MYRRMGSVLFIVLVAWSGWMLARPVTHDTGWKINNQTGIVTRVTVECGQAIPIVFQSEYGDRVPDTARFTKGECTKEARTRLATAGFVALAGLVFLVMGLVRGPAPPVPSIHDVLQPLPSPRSLVRSVDEDL